MCLRMQQIKTPQATGLASPSNSKYAAPINMGLHHPVVVPAINSKIIGQAAHRKNKTEAGIPQPPSRLAHHPQPSRGTVERAVVDWCSWLQVTGKCLRVERPWIMA